MLNSITPQYLNGKQAAAFLGYSYRQFKEYARKAQIPKNGPKRNRYDKDDLRAFMMNPTAFLRQAPKRRPKDGYTPVEI